MSTTTYKMTVNVPVDMKLEHIDVWPNDPSKNEGKGYGASLALTGQIKGQPSRIYPKGFLNKNIEKLVASEVIEDGHYELDPAEHYSIPAMEGHITVVNSQPAGERYANFDILEVIRAGNGKPPVAKKDEKKPVSIGHPGFLEGADAEDAAELQSKVAPEKPKKHQAGDAYRALTLWVLSEIVPLYEKAELGLTAEAAAACVQTLFIQASQRGKIE